MMAKTGPKKGTRTGPKKVFNPDDLPVPSGYYDPPKVSGLSPFHRAVARAWASGDFKTKVELAKAMGVSLNSIKFMFNKPDFVDEVGRISRGISEHHANIADDVGRMAVQALEVYAKVMESEDIPLREKKRAAKELIDWGIKLEGLDKSEDGQRAKKIINQQFNIAGASEDELRKIIGENTGIGRK
jgi:hypothetical protein